MCFIFFGEIWKGTSEYLQEGVCRELKFWYIVFWDPFLLGVTEGMNRLLLLRTLIDFLLI